MSVRTLWRATGITRSIITTVAQYAAYTPYGSLFREYRSVQPYKFNGKELDQETGYYYYGARYYDPITALWLGTDPLKHKYPGIGAYVYCAGNPVRYVDPTGMDWVEHDETSDLTWNNDVTSADNTPDGFTYRGTSYTREKVWTNQLVR